MRDHLRPLRLTIALASAMAGTIHTVAAIDHLHAPVLLVGGFLAAAIAQFAVAGAALAISEPRRLVGVALAVHLPCIAAWTTSRTVGLEPLHHASAVGALDLLAASFAACAILSGVLAVRRHPSTPSTSGMLVAACLAVGLLVATPLVAVDELHDQGSAEGEHHSPSDHDGDDDGHGH